MSKKAILAVTLTLGLIGMTACGDSAEAEAPDTGTSAELTEITVGGVVTTSTVPIYIAQSEGIFEKHGLEVTMVPTQNFSAAAPSVLSGELDFAMAATPPFIMAIDQGLELQAVAGTSATVEDPKLEGNQLVVSDDSGITELDDLKGKTVATNQIGSGPYVGVLATYIRSGGNPDDIEWVSMPMNEQIQALESGTIDGAVLAEPFTTMATTDGHVPIVSAFRTPGNEIFEPGDPYVVMLGARSYLDANPDIAEAMQAAMVEANQVAAENPEMVSELLISEAEIDPTIAETLLQPGFVGELTGDELQRMGDAMTDTNMLTNPFDGAAAVWKP